MPILVSDTSVLVDLERGSFTTGAFRLPFEFVVPDLLYERELRRHAGPELLRLGLRVAALDGEGVLLALSYGRKRAALSMADTFALALAVRNGWTLLTGDRELRSLAAAEQVTCHGVLWLLDQMFESGVTDRRTLHSGLTVLSNHPRCRLPKGEVRARLDRWRKVPTG